MYNWEKYTPSIAGVLFLFFILINSADTSPSLGVSDLEKINSTFSRPERIQAIGKIVHEYGFGEALRRLSSLNDPRPGEVHLLAHEVGKIAYETKKEAGIFECATDETRGCGHGFFIAAFTARGYGDTEGLLKRCMGISSSPYNGEVACFHGLGHAIIAFQQYHDLSGALKECDNLIHSFGNIKYQENCYYGVFMENIFGIHDGKDFKERDFFDPKKLLFPCDVVGEPYEAWCYINQPSWWRMIGISFEEVGKLCGGVYNSKSQENCYKGMALSINVALGNLNIPKAARECARWIDDDRGKEICIVTIAEQIVYTDKTGYAAIAACASLPPPGSLRCYERIIKRAKDMNAKDKIDLYCPYVFGHSDVEACKEI